MNDCESPALEREGYNLSKMKGGHLVGFQSFRDSPVPRSYSVSGVFRHRPLKEEQYVKCQVTGKITLRIASILLRGQ